MHHPLLMQAMMPGAHVGGTHQQPPMPQHPQLFSTFQTSNRGVPPLSSKRSSYSPKDYTTAASGGVSNSVEHLFLYDGHSTTSSTGSRRSIASNSHHLRSYQQQPIANPSGRAVTQHGPHIYDTPLDRKIRSPVSPPHANTGRPKEISSRFKDRYRSNSLDSILVTDLNHKVFSGPTKEGGLLDDDSDPVNSQERILHSPPSQLATDNIPQFSNVRHSTTIFHLHPPQHHLIPKHHPGSDSTTVDGAEDLTNNCDKNGANQDKSSNIQKRPTFDSLDKRKSWSVETNTNTSG